MTRPLRIAQVAPVAQRVPPVRSGSVESVTALLTEGLVAAGHDVTLFATAESRTTAALHATHRWGYAERGEQWPWEMYELTNIAAAIERSDRFDVIHCHAIAAPFSLPFTRLSHAPVLHTVHHLPAASEVALWCQYPDAKFVALSGAQARALAPLPVAGIVPHGVDVTAFEFQAAPADYLLFLGRFTPGKGVLEAIALARAVGMPLVLAACANEYYDQHVAPQVDGRTVIYAGEADPRERSRLLGGARALLYPLQQPEPFGLVAVEAMLCGTPVAALDCGAVREIVTDDLTGVVRGDLDSLQQALPHAMALDRQAISAEARRRFSVAAMVAGYTAVYRQLTVRSQELLHA